METRQAQDDKEETDGRRTAMGGSSLQLTLKKGAPEGLLCVQLASYQEGGPLMWIMP